MSLVRVAEGWKSSDPDQGGRFAESLSHFLTRYPSGNTRRSYAFSIVEFWDWFAISHESALPSPRAIHPSVAVDYANYLRLRTMGLDEYRLAQDPSRALDLVLYRTIKQNPGAQIAQLRAELLRHPEFHYRGPQPGLDPMLHIEAVDDFGLDKQLACLVERKTLRRRPSLDWLRRRDPEMTRNVSERLESERLGSASQGLFTYTIDPHTTAQDAERYSSIATRLAALAAFWTYLQNTGTNMGETALIQHQIWQQPLKQAQKRAPDLKRNSRERKTPNARLYQLILLTTWDRLPDGSWEKSDRFCQVRDRAILLFLIWTGVRAEELCALCRKDIVLNDGVYIVTVMGKGGKQRAFGVPPEAVEALNELNEKLQQLAGEAEAKDDSVIARTRELMEPSAPVFPAIKRWGANMGSNRGEIGPMSRSAIAMMLRRRAFLAVDEKNQPLSKEDFARIHPHGVRHLAAKTALDSGVPAPVVQYVLGHSSLAVTGTYLEQHDVRRVILYAPLARAAPTFGQTGFGAPEARPGARPIPTPPAWSSGPTWGTPPPPAPAATAPSPARRPAPDVARPPFPPMAPAEGPTDAPEAPVADPASIPPWRRPGATKPTPKKKVPVQVTIDTTGETVTDATPPEDRLIALGESLPEDADWTGPEMPPDPNGLARIYEPKAWGERLRHAPLDAPNQIYFGTDSGLVWWGGPSGNLHPEMPVMAPSQIDDVQLQIEKLWRAWFEQPEWRDPNAPGGAMRGPTAAEALVSWWAEALSVSAAANIARLRYPSVAWVPFGAPLDAAGALPNKAPRALREHLEKPIGDWFGARAQTFARNLSGKKLPVDVLGGVPDDADLSWYRSRPQAPPASKVDAAWFGDADPLWSMPPEERAQLFDLLSALCGRDLTDNRPAFPTDDPRVTRDQIAKVIRSLSTLDGMLTTRYAIRHEGAKVKKETEAIVAQGAWIDETVALLREQMGLPAIEFSSAHAATERTKQVWRVAHQADPGGKRDIGVTYYLKMVALLFGEEVSEDLVIKMVARHPSGYLNKEHFESHDAKYTIADFFRVDKGLETIVHTPQYARDFASMAFAHSECVARRTARLLWEYHQAKARRLFNRAVNLKEQLEQWAAYLIPCSGDQELALERQLDEQYRYSSSGVGDDPGHAIFTGRVRRLTGEREPPSEEEERPMARLRRNGRDAVPAAAFALVPNPIEMLSWLA